MINSDLRQNRFKTTIEYYPIIKFPDDPRFASNSPLRESQKPASKIFSTPPHKNDNLHQQENAARSSALSAEKQIQPSKKPVLQTVRAFSLNVGSQVLNSPASQALQALGSSFEGLQIRGIFGCVQEEIQRLQEKANRLIQGFDNFDKNLSSLSSEIAGVDVARLEERTQRLRATTGIYREQSVWKYCQFFSLAWQSTQPNVAQVKVASKHANNPQQYDQKILDRNIKTVRKLIKTAWKLNQYRHQLTQLTQAPYLQNFPKEKQQEIRITFDNLQRHLDTLSRMLSPATLLIQNEHFVQAGKTGDWCYPLVLHHGGSRDSGKLQADSVYFVSRFNNYKSLQTFVYKTDAQKKTIYAKGNLTLGCASDRFEARQKEVGHLGGAGYVGGHLIATRFGGPGESINVVCMHKDFNVGQGQYSSFENAMNQPLKDGRTVRVTIKPNYYSEKKFSPATSQVPQYIPSEIHIKRKIDGALKMEQNGSKWLKLTNPQPN